MCSLISVPSYPQSLTITLIDGHVDFPGLVRMAYQNKIETPEFKEAFENGTLLGHVDLRRLRDGQAGGTFWSVYAPCPEKGDDFSDENLAPSMLPISLQFQTTLEKLTCTQAFNSLLIRSMS